VPRANCRPADAIRVSAFLAIREGSVGIVIVVMVVVVITPMMVMMMVVIIAPPPIIIVMMVMIYPDSLRIRENFLEPLLAAPAVEAGATEDIIKVTPEMIEAGGRVILRFDKYYDGYEATAKRVFIAMMSARNACSIFQDC
jgi:hypothetical protein